MSNSIGPFEAIMNFRTTIKTNRFWQQCQTVGARVMNKHERIKTDQPPQVGGSAA